MDINVQAFRLVSAVTDDKPAAVQRKRIASSNGGVIGGKKRAEKLTPERRVEISRKASLARWGTTTADSTN